MINPTVASTHRTRLAALLLSLVIPTGLAAQSPPSARIEGRVVDSTHAVRPVAGAIVQAVRIGAQAFASVQADSLGRYHFDTLAAGRYWLSFSAPFRDSLGGAVPDREVVVADGARVAADLAIPSGATLRAVACPGLPLAPAHGAVMGVVLDAVTEQPLRGATVALGWSDFSMDRATLKMTTKERTGAVRADSSGQYRLCGVPTDVPLHLQVQLAGKAGGVVDVLVRDSVGLVRQDLSLDREAALPIEADSGAVRRPLMSGGATVTGVVFGTGGRPLADVDVRIAGARGSARSDSSGRFALSGMPAGTHMLEARRIGYQSARLPVELRRGQPLTQQVQLHRVVTLDSIRIVARRIRYAEFERRRGNAFGTFLDEKQILQRNPFETSDIFRMQPGFQVLNDTLVSTRGGTLAEPNCATNVVIDGAQHMSLGFVHPSDIAAIEIYRSTVGAPPQYDGFCGLVIIWTKR